MGISRWHWLGAGALLLALVGCEKQDGSVPPQAPSSAEDVRYAEDYPNVLTATRQRIDGGKAEVQEKSGQYGSYVGQIKEPTDWPVYHQVVEKADASGAGQGYAERAQENDAVAAIIEENDGEVRKKVASGVSYAAKQGGCNADLGGAAAGAMKRAFDQRMEDRLRERNEAHAVIDRYFDRLGKANEDTMRKQADDIARASYVARVQLPTARADLQRLIDERNAVGSTIDAAIEDEKAFQAEPGTSDKAKKASADRVADLEKAKAELEAAQTYDEAALEQLDDEIAASQAALDDALAALLEAIDAKAAAAPPAAPAG
ncbi:MAG: hypothetical protein KC731_24045 [Myxococcales bacterium]|nr:hypothetical protein [Myxococcales bacterium]